MTTTPARPWAPGARRITDGIPLGERADRTALSLDLWTTAHGSRHPLMGGASGSGKTNTLNVITCGLAACGDTVIWAIEVAKAGQGQAAWLPCFDWLATRLPEAVAMLEAAVAIIDARSRILAAAASRGKGDDKHVPTIDQPALVIIIDEAAALFSIKTGDPDRIELAAQATELARQISQTGRSAGVGLLVTTQRPTVAALGDDGDFRSQLHPNLCLRMNRRADVGFVLQNVDLDTVDTTLFNVAGLLYLQDGPDVDPLPVRSYALYQPPVVNRLARILATGRPPLDPVARDAAGEPYAARPADPFNAPTTLTTGAGVRTTPQPVSTMPRPTTAPSTARRQAGKDALRDAHVAANADAELPEVAPIPLRKLTPDTPPDNSGDPADAAVRDAITAALATAGLDGLTSRQLIKAVEKTRGATHRASIYRTIRTLIDNNHARRSGEKNAYRYHPHTSPADALGGTSDSHAA